MFDMQEVKKNVVKWTSKQGHDTNSSGKTLITDSRSGKHAGASPAVIGPSIHFEGQLKGEEALVIEGRVEGTIDLKDNDLTIGVYGKIKANVYANTIRVDGEVKGDLHGKERVHISQTGKVTGNIFAPRVSIEDGAHFRGSIDMDGKVRENSNNDAEKLKSA